MPQPRQFTFQRNLSSTLPPPSINRRRTMNTSKMASVISVSANEGSATAAAKQQAASPAYFFINRAVRVVTVVNAPNTKKDQEKLPKDSEDIESIKGKFCWKLIAGHHVPYIIRVINGEHLKFVSVRMAETQLLNKYLHYLHADIYTCTSIRSHFITDSEAKLLNEINQKHVDYLYGKEMFFAGKDYIVRLEDVHEFYTFIEVCYKKLLCNFTPGRKEKCGFIHINSEFAVPYCTIDDQKYFPLFYFEGETENLRHRTVKLENWNLAYLKFCCLVQGMRKNELFASDSCTVISFDDIKNSFPPETNFEEHWPTKVVDIQLINQKSAHVNLSGAWIRAPPEVVPAENSISHGLTAPAPVSSQSMPVSMNTYQNGWPANQMVNSYSTQAQVPSTTRGYSIAARNQSIAAQCYNAGSTMSQGNSLINGAGHVPPPLVHADNTALVIGQMRQFYTQRPNNKSKAHQQQLQQQPIQQHQQQQELITTPQIQQSYSAQSVQGYITNIQQCNTLSNVGLATATPPTEIVDLSSPPSSPVPPTVQESSLHPLGGLELTRIPERMSAHDTFINAAYKIQKTTLHGRLIHCINAKPYIYSDLMVTLDDLVQMLPSCTVARCALVLNKYLKIMLFIGNSEQLAVLSENGRLRSMYPNETPMAKLQDVTHVLGQLKKLVAKQNEQMRQYQSVGSPSKRQRIC